MSVGPLLTDGPDPLARLRRRAWVEGASLLLLVGVAVPLKHLAHLPAATRVMGLVHGLAFLMYGISILEAWGTGALSGRRAALALGAAVVPGGTFVFARTLHGASGAGPLSERRRRGGGGSRP